MRLIAVAVSALLLAGAAPALAQSPEQSPQSQRPQPTRVSAVPSQRVVLICETDAATRTAFARQFGVEPVFLTAREAVEAKTAGQAWTTPRCMTEREHGRYVQLTQAYAAH
ncbi:hypothetical protein [Brevundimonas sp.]|uniref:hypothetical protein n=1 Tax=Brevundimonas sp. TaxID=1871086 RepID=UPI002EDA313F